MVFGLKRPLPAPPQPPPPPSPEPLQETVFQERVEALANQIWVAEGRPLGRADIHWQVASELAKADAAPAESSLVEDIQRLQFQSDLAEVQLLLDYISGRPDKAFGSSQGAAKPLGGPASLAASAAPVDTQAVTQDELREIATIRFPPVKGTDANAADAARLLQVRDKLNRYVFPASGLTIAFTLLTWAPFHNPSNNAENNKKWARWRLANQAYPRLERSLMLFRLSAIAISVLAVLVTWATVWTSNKVSDGQAKINRIQAIDRLQVAMIDTLAQVATVSTVPRQGKTANRGPALVVRYCQKPDLLKPIPIRTGNAGQQIQVFDSPQQYATCDKFNKLQRQAETELTDLRQWWSEWQSWGIASTLVSSGCWILRQTGWRPGDCKAAGESAPASVTSQNNNPHESPAGGTILPATDLAADGSVISFTKEVAEVSDTLADLTNIWLPVAYGFIGSIVAALRSIYSKVSNSTLAPWDARLIWTRVMLGVIAGACIGLFFSPSGTTVQGLSTVGSLSISAVAFLAGYSVDGLFSLLDEIIRRLFDTSSAPTRPTT